MNGESNANHSELGAQKSWAAVHVTAREQAHEAVEYGLMEAGARGTETRDENSLAALVRITAYFDSAPPLAYVRDELTAALRIYNQESDAVLEIATSEEQSRDWLAEWKKSWQPVTVADTFIIAPPWSEVHAAPGTHVLRIEPGMAFGTGTHETTRLCLAAIARAPRDTMTILDVGTGTGILAIAAAYHMPNAHIEAYDTDADAVRIARENAKLNRVADRISFSASSIDDATASASLVCANLTADVILPLLPLLVRLTCERLVLSGILATQAESVRTRLHELGIGEVETLADGEWVAIIA